MGLPLSFAPEYRPAGNPHSSPVEENPQWQISLKAVVRLALLDWARDSEWLIRCLFFRCD